MISDDNGIPNYQNQSWFQALKQQKWSLQPKKTEFTNIGHWGKRWWTEVGFSKIGCRVCLQKLRMFQTCVFLAGR